MAAGNIQGKKKIVVLGRKLVTTVAWLSDSKNALLESIYWEASEVYLSAVQIQLELMTLSSYYNHCILLITMGRIVMHYPSNANSKCLVAG